MVTLNLGFHRFGDSVGAMNLQIGSPNLANFIFRESVWACSSAVYRSFFFFTPPFTFKFKQKNIMGFFIRSLVTQQSKQVWRAYSTNASDITVKAMVYSSYGKPSEVLK